MKAIINVKKGSAYSKFNGLTFDVAEIIGSGTLISLSGLHPHSPTLKTDFTDEEVMIVDVVNEIKKANENFYEGNNRSILANLQKYCIKKGIKYLD